FTATAVVAQPLTGIALAHEAGYSLGESWIVLSIILYFVTGAFWLPVVWIQLQMRNLAAASASQGKPLPSRYHTLFRIWFAFGFPAFGAVMGIFWLMISRPSIWSRQRGRRASLLALHASVGLDRPPPTIAQT